MKKIICWAALVLALCLPVCALAATEPNTRTIEDTTTYEGETIQITIDQWCYAFNRTSLRFFVANVYVDDPAQLQTAFAGEEYSKSNSEATSAIAERHDAILAVNGDYYNYKDKNGLVIRNGVLYRDEASTRDQLLILNDGTFVALPARPHITRARGRNTSTRALCRASPSGRCWSTTARPVELPEKYIISTKDTIREPRTAIGQVDANHYVIIVADGRRDGWSDKGMTLQELQQVFVEQGCKVAYNLDGGGSATMVLGDQRVNKTSGSRERDVSDIVYFTK